MSLVFDGERYVPEIGGVIHAEHLHRYRLARVLAAGKDVLDVACGEGYGSDLLADVAQSVVGVDISTKTVEYAQQTYPRDNLRSVPGDCAELPCEVASFDLVVSFETIEHHDRHDEMLREFRRVLRAGGILLISSPNRPEFNLAASEPNPFHVKELDFAEFAALLQMLKGPGSLFYNRICLTISQVAYFLIGRMCNFDALYIINPYSVNSKEPSF